MLKVLIYYTGEDYELLDAITNELIDGGFQSREEAKYYCEKWGYDCSN